MMNRRNITVLLLMLTGVSALPGCSTTAIHQDHGYYSGYYSDYYYGPPPLAPAHGYRHYYHGHDLVYDSYLRVYIVLGEVNHYYYRGNYYRYDDHDKHWYCRSGFNKNWYVYDHRTPLPAGLVKKHRGHDNPQGHKQGIVNKDYGSDGNRYRSNSQQGKARLQYHENRNYNANDRDNRAGNNNRGGDIQPHHDGYIQPRYNGSIQPGLVADKDNNKGYRGNNNSRSIQGIKRKSGSDISIVNQDDRPGRGSHEKKQENRKQSNNQNGFVPGHSNTVIKGKSRSGVYAVNQDNRPGHGGNELKQGNIKQNKDRAPVNRVNRGKRDKVQQKTYVGSKTENSSNTASNNHDAGDHDRSGKSNSKRHGSKKSKRSSSFKH